MTTRLSLASLFTSDAIASTFDAQCEAQALQGRTYPPLLGILNDAYGLKVPASTASAIKFLNAHLFAMPKVPKLAKGVGAKAAAVTVTQAMHAYAVALRAGMADPAKAPEVSPLPLWADPVAIAKAKAAAKDKRDAKKVDSAAEGAGADNADTAPEAITLTPARDIRAEALAAWAKFAAYLDHPAITAAERDAFGEILAKAVVMPSGDVVTTLAVSRALAEAPALH